MGSLRFRILVTLGLAAATAGGPGVVEALHTVAHAALTHRAVPHEHEHDQPVPQSTGSGSALDQAQPSHDHDSIDQAAVSQSGPAAALVASVSLDPSDEAMVRYQILAPEREFRPPNPPHQQPPTRAPPPPAGFFR